MPAKVLKRRNVEDEVRRPKKKIRKFKKQKEYHSSSEDDEDEPHTQPEIGSQIESKVAKNSKRKRTIRQEAESQPSIAALTEGGAREATKDSSESEEEEDDNDDEQLQINTALNMSAHDDSEGNDEDDGEEEVDVAVDDLNDLDEDDQDDDDEMIDEYDSDGTSAAGTTKKKRNDPTAFATSISKILTTKLSTQKRVDPILSRSKSADEANKALADGKLETKARASIRAEKRSLLERGRVKDVLGLETDGVDTGAIMEEEKRLKKTAQRGVVKLFNAVRAAQVKAEEAGRLAREEGVVGMHKREERINEMSKEGFLDLISRGGKPPIEA